MKTTKGIALTFLGDNGICVRADWYKGGRNQLISGKDYTPESLHNLIEHLRSARDSEKPEVYNEDTKLEDLSDGELIHIAKQMGMEDLRTMDCDGGLANTDEVIAAIKEVDEN